MTRLLSLLLLFFSVCSFSQETLLNSFNGFNSWSMSFHIGTSIMDGADINSINKGFNEFNTWDLGTNFEVGISKVFSPVFEMGISSQFGRTKQSIDNRYLAETKFTSFNVSSYIHFNRLFWPKSQNEFHVLGVAGVGLMRYQAFINDQDSITDPLILVTDEYKSLGNIQAFYGINIRHKISEEFDIELMGKVINSFQEDLDGSAISELIAMRNNNKNEKIITISLGITYKIDSEKGHLRWGKNKKKQITPTTTKNDNTPCKDGDQDGICDDRDLELDTPFGARIDGNGIALDVDLDGVIDLYDKCVTVPGPKENNGCPIDTQ